MEKIISMFNIYKLVVLLLFNNKKFTLFLSYIFLYNSILFINLKPINALCQFNGIEHKEYSNWVSECNNCTCVGSIPFCKQIQCKYEPCELGKVLILNDDQCCPTCQQPKKACHYDGYLINHNTEFSPKLCTTCKCKNGVMECADNCQEQNENDPDFESENDILKHLQITSLFQRKERLRQHHRNFRTRNNLNQYDNISNSKQEINEHVKSICYHDKRIHQFNSTWSPLKCTQCKCNYNSMVDCYVHECPPLKCSNGIELDPNECCPKCKPNEMCHDKGIYYKEGDYWTDQNDPCIHCSCSKGMINCLKENCTITSCPKNDVLVTKSNRCCPQCESQMNENCEYYGKMHYNGEMWYTSGCQHCACSSGRVICMNVQCESTFCLKDEIMVKKKDDCCIRCRKPLYCTVDNNLKIKENDYWVSTSMDFFQKTSSNPCKLCQCVEGQLVCFTKSCQNSRYPSFAHLSVYLNEKKQINARTIPFLADFIKGLNKESLVYVTAGPMHTNLYLDDKPVNYFKLGDIASSRVYYKISSFDDFSNDINSVREMNLKTGESNEDQDLKQENDYLVLSFVSHDDQAVYNVLIQFEIFKSINELDNNIDQIKTRKEESLLPRSLKNLNQNFNSDRNIRGYEKNKIPNNKDHSSLKLSQTPKKTIFIQPGEAIKLTSNELKPKNLPANTNPDKLIYFLVSANPKYGELKLKKVFSSDENVPIGWNKVNDLYLEKPVKDFTQNDLDNGNVWYEPFNDFSSLNDINTISSGCNKTSKNKIKKKLCLFGENCGDDVNEIEEENKDCNEDQYSNMPSLSLSSDSSQAKYDHCMFEVYDQDKLNELISKEIIHFSIQNEIINETVLGLEVIENQITPLTFSNFDIAGIDSSRDYLIYRIIKNLEKNQGQLEHVNKPGVPIETFTQNDLNKGLILYYSPKEIGVSPREFFFTFVVTNDNRSDTFPETPFHVKVLPSNDQAPTYKEPISNINILQSGSLILSRDLFDVEDPDTSLDNIIFSIEKSPDNSVIELRSKGQRYVIAKDDSFTIQEIRDGTFRLIHNGANNEKDLFKVSVSDNKHISIKTININVKLIDKIAPRISDRTTMLLNVKEAQVKTIRRENLAYVDDRSAPEEIFFKLISHKNSIGKRNAQPKLVGKLYNRDKVLTISSIFTQADIDLQNIRYEAPQEIAQNMLTEIIYFDVNDKEGNIVKDQAFTIKVEPVDNQPPVADILQQIKVLEGGYLILNESYIQVRDTDSAKEQLNIIIDSQPSFGYLENIHKGTKLSSFPLVDLIDGLSIRYVQNDHQNKEPNLDSFIFHVSDGINESPTYKFSINIELVNDEKPVAIFEPLFVEFNKKAIFTNSTFNLVDFDTKPEELIIHVEEFPKYGKIFNSNNQLTSFNNKFSYSDVLKKQISYRLDDRAATKDEIKLKITDGTFSTYSKYLIKKLSNEKNSPIIEKNEGLQAIAGHIFPITGEMLKSISRNKLNDFDYSDYNFNNKKFNNEYLFTDNMILYHVIIPPTFGKLQYRFDNFFQEIAGPRSYMNTFTQKDIDQGRIFYNHGINEPTGVTSVTFNVSDSNNNILPDQRFIITVRGDKLPPVITVNKGIKVNQAQSVFLTRFDLDVKDDDTLLQNLKFHIVTQPKLGRLENIKEPGKRIDMFSYEDLIYNKIKYVHEELISTKSKMYSDENNQEFNFLKDDLIDLKVSDGKNDASTSVHVSILRSDNQMPILKSTFSMRVKELERKQLTTNEIKVIDRDTPNEHLKIIITHPPQYGTLEKQIIVPGNNHILEKKIEDQIISLNTNLNQKLNFILKFNNNHTSALKNSREKQSFVTINEFTMSDLEKGLIYYNHRSPGARQDRFGFIVYDGYNNMFIIDDGIQVSSYQIFNINIDLDKNQPPVLEKNIGLDYLYQMDGFPGRLIMRNELSIIDKDDADSALVIEITRKPLYGYIQHKDRPGMAIYRFTQLDINQNKISYILRKVEDNIFEDFFEFDVYDLANNALKQNRFDIKWSILNFEEQEITVMENDGKARVHIKKSGNLKQFSMVTCKTVSDTAKSNRDSKLFDFIYTHVRIEFNEDESYKACDVIINKDNQIEPIESFFVIIEDSKYSIIGSKNQIKVNILDKKKESIIEFEKVKFEIQESDKFISLPIIRSGELSTDVFVECLTADETAIGNLDYLPRVRDNLNSNIVKIPAGEVYGFCDIEILDDDLNEVQTEYFKTYLSSPSATAKVGSKSEARIGIIGPNDVLVNDCKTIYHTFSEKEGKLTIEITREKISLNETLEVLVQNIPTNDIYIKSYLNNFSDDLKKTNIQEISLLTNFKNITIASPDKDFEQINHKIKFLPGEIIKKFYVNIFKNDLTQTIEDLKIFTIQIKPIVNLRHNLSVCDYINPDIVNVVIGDQKEDGITVGFNQTSMFVNETSKLIKVPIIRSGDLSKPFSLICYTRQQTAIEEKDYIGRGSFEQSRIHFDSGDKIKYCNVEIINDSIFEADETFQIKLSDLRGSSDIRFNQYTTLTATILNNEDSSVVSLSDEVYYTEEPLSSDSSIVRPITIIRTGDLSRVTLVRVITSDDTAIAGLDYKPKTEIIRFNPGVSALDFEVEIFHDIEKESLESFKVILGPQDPVSGVFGKIKVASVIIRDSYLLLNNSSNLTENQNSSSTSSEVEKSNLPYLNSLAYYVLDQSPGYDQINSLVPTGEPLICLEPCNTKNPNYSKNKNLCDGLFRKDDKQIKIVYSWEISTPNEFGIYSQFVKLIDNSLFSFVNESILEPIYFQARFRVRCTVNFIRETSDRLISSITQENIKAVKSNYVQISENNELISKIKDNKKCIELWKEKTKESENLNYTDTTPISSGLPLSHFYSKSLHLQSNLPLINFKFDKPFIARADYISAEFIKNNPNIVDIDYLNYVRLSIEIPFMDGILPLISTMPLHNYRHLLNGDSGFSLNHICSNFIDFSQNDINVKYGFVKDIYQDLADSFDKNINNELFELNEKSNGFRNKKTLQFYSSLDKEKCLWKFVAYYDITELTTYCQAQIISSDSDQREDFQSDKSYLIIKIPLYVSYLYASHQVSWSSIDYKTNVEASIIYKTKSPFNSDSNNDLISTQFQQISSLFNNNYYDNKKLNENSKQIGIDQSLKDKHLVSLTVSKISMTENGKLIIEFSTIPYFHGQFVKYHPALPNHESKIISPDDPNISFNLELVWSQYTYDYPEQTWKATSTSVLNNYSGNYTIRLVPCHAKANQPFKYPFECEPREPINYTIPITVEQSTMPVPVKYSLGTRFTLSNNLISSINPLNNNNNFDGYFRRGDSIYGTILWDGDQDQKSVYKLELDKVYLCSSYNDFVPVYDPEGNIYNKGPQFGCSKPHKALKHRILLLDRNTDILKAQMSQLAGQQSSLNNSVNVIKKSKFEAQFLNEVLNSGNHSKLLNSEKLRKHLIIDGFKFSVSMLFDIENITKKSDLKSRESGESLQSKEIIWYIQTMFYIRPSLSVSSVKSKRDTRQLYSHINSYSLKDVYNNGTNMHIIRLTTDNKKSSLLTSRIKSVKNRLTDSKSKLNVYDIKNEYGEAYVKIIVPIIIFLVIATLSVITLIYYKKREIHSLFFNKINSDPPSKNEVKNQAQLDLSSSNNSNSNDTKIKFDLIKFVRIKFLPNSQVNKQTELINTSGENYSGSNSTSDTIVVVSPLLENNCQQQTRNSYYCKQQDTKSNPKNRNTEAFKPNEESNLTFQTLISSNTAATNINLTGSSTLSNNNFNNNLIINGYSPSQINEEDHYIYSNSTPINVNENRRPMCGSDAEVDPIEEEETNQKEQNTQRSSEKRSISFKSIFNKVSFLNKSSKTKRLKTSRTIKREFFNSSNGEYEDLTKNFIETNHNRQFVPVNTNQERAKETIQSTMNFPKYPTAKRNNYLYYNYNNNKMNYFNNTPEITNDLIINEHEIANELHGHRSPSAKLIITTSPLMTTETIAAISSLSSSTPTQITPVSSTTKCSIANSNNKRLSGTEV